MAVDQALLISADQSGDSTLRFYSWSTPTLSLGYFQSYDDRKRHEPSLKCAVVRRASGGGAIVHDREITYSLCIPSVNRWSTRNCELYKLVHQEISAVLAGFGIDSRLVEKSLEFESKDGADHPRAFLCFQRRTPGDIIVGKHKIGGSAQRRLKNSLIQHGSILLARSNCAPELPGILEVTEFEVARQEFCRELAIRFSDKLDLRLEPSKLSDEEKRLCDEVKSAQFGNREWTKKR